MLFIVGAGPGDLELLTIKAYNLIKKAKIILFDNLINKEILGLAGKNCIKIYVGKHPYGNYTPQQDINALIEYYSKQFDQIVRLKGGDPYLFGRGFEEWTWAKALGLEVQYIPGISSMQGAGLNDIPLTHRGVSEGLWLLTGMKQNGEITADLKLAVQSNSTVILYMAMGKLAEIARTYVLHNKGDTPAAIIQQASLAQQKKVICQVKDIERISNERQLQHPAILIIGQVVLLQYQLDALVANHRHIG